MIQNIAPARIGATQKNNFQATASKASTGFKKSAGEGENSHTKGKYIRDIIIDGLAISVIAGCVVYLLNLIKKNIKL